MKKHIQLASLFLAASLAAVAQDSGTRVFRQDGQWIEETTGTLTAVKTVKVKTSSGAIAVNGTSQNNITYTVRKRARASSEDAARREFANLRFTAYDSADTALFRGDCDNRCRASIDFDIHVPSRTYLVRAETSGGSIAANAVSGRVEAITGGGAIHIDKVGEGFANSGGGNIEIGSVDRDVRVETGGGNIKIASAGGQIIASSGGGMLDIGVGKGMSLETGGGTIQVNRCSGAMKASTGGGSIYVKQVNGHAQVESGGGSIHIGPVQGGVRVETGSGPIIAVLANGGGEFTDSRLETSAGDIVVYIPDDLKVTIRAAIEVARGSGISSELPGVKITNGNQQWGPREAYAEGALNGGGPILHVHTTTGSIEFKRENKK